jgi:hypothetical protein
MWYQISGFGAVLEPLADIYPPSTPLTVRVKAESVDHLEADYAIYDGLPLGDGTFAVFDDMPTIEPLPADQLNILVGAPTLFDLDLEMM